MLRLGLIENLRRVTARLVVARHDRDLADEWGDRLQGMAERHPSRLVVVVAAMAEGELPISSAFVAEFCQRLSRQGPVVHLARGWLEQRLAEQGLSIEQLVHLESQSQAADQMSVSHTMAACASSGPPTGGSSSRNRASWNGRCAPKPPGSMPPWISPRATNCSPRGGGPGTPWSAVGTGGGRPCHGTRGGGSPTGDRTDRVAHVGYYLIDQGQPDLERATAVRWPWRTVLERTIRRFPLAAYAGGILGFTAIVALGVGQQAWALEVRGWRLAGLVTVFVLCASQLAVTLLNWLSILLVKPRLLPDWTSRRASRPVPHDGGGAHPAGQCGRDRRVGRIPGDPLPGQPGPEPLLRLADRLPRCRERDAARGRRAAPDGPGRGSRG